MATVIIPCPRCGGQGHGNWNPDNGICYRCKGNRQVRIDTARHLKALGFLRSKYVRLLGEVRAAEEKGGDEDIEFARRALGYCVESGLRVRSDLEAAGVKL